jgi:hypothetical protein
MKIHSYDIVLEQRLLAGPFGRRTQIGQVAYKGDSKPLEEGVQFGGFGGL